MIAPFKFKSYPCEYKVIALREMPLPKDMFLCDNPQTAVNYWETLIQKDERYNPEVESLFVLMLNIRSKIKGHYLINSGTVDGVVVHPREIFRLAIMTSAKSIILMHNHPSGESNPSESDIRMTRQIIQCGKILGIDVLDHVIVGNNEYSSLKELGYFFS